MEPSKEWIRRQKVSCFFVLLMFLSVWARSRAQAVEAIKIDLISPAQCESRMGKLIGCQLGPWKIDQSGNRTVGIPLNTVFQVITNGNCSTQFPLSIHIRSEIDLAQLQMSVVQSGKASLRSLNGKTVGGILLSDATKWTQHAVFDGSCRSLLEIYLDIPDVEDWDGAVLWIREHIQKIQEDRLFRDVLSELYSSRYVFKLLYEMSKNFFQQLTAEAAFGVKAHIANLSELMHRLKPRQPISQEDEISLRQLEVFLEHLSLREIWQTSDLNSFFNEQDRGFLKAMVEQTGLSNETEEKLNKVNDRLSQSCQNLLWMKEQVNHLAIDEAWMEFIDVLEFCKSKN